MAQCPTTIARRHAIKVLHTRAAMDKTQQSSDSLDSNDGTVGSDSSSPEYGLTSTSPRTWHPDIGIHFSPRSKPHLPHARSFSTHPPLQARSKLYSDEMPPMPQAATARKPSSAPYIRPGGGQTPTSAAARLQRPASPAPVQPQVFDTPTSAKGALQAQLATAQSAVEALTHENQNLHSERQSLEKSIQERKDAQQKLEAQLRDMDKQLSSLTDELDAEKRTKEQVKEEYARKDRARQDTIEERLSQMWAEQFAATQSRLDQEEHEQKQARQQLQQKIDSLDLVRAKLQEDIASKQAQFEATVDVLKTDFDSYLSTQEAHVDNRFKDLLARDRQKRADQRADFRKQVLAAVTPYANKVRADAQSQVALATRGYLARHEKRSDYKSTKSALFKSVSGALGDARAVMRRLGEQMARIQPSTTQTYVADRVQRTQAMIDAHIARMTEYESALQLQGHHNRARLHEVLFRTDRSPHHIRQMSRYFAYQTMTERAVQYDKDAARPLYRMLVGFSALSQAERWHDLLHEPPEIQASSLYRHTEPHTLYNNKVVRSVTRGRLPRMSGELLEVLNEMGALPYVAAQKRAQRVVLQKLLGQWTEDDAKRLNDCIVSKRNASHQALRHAWSLMLPRSRPRISSAPRKVPVTSTAPKRRALASKKHEEPKRKMRKGNEKTLGNEDKAGVPTAAPALVTYTVPRPRPSKRPRAASRRLSIPKRSYSSWRGGHAGAMEQRLHWSPAPDNILVTWERTHLLQGMTMLRAIQQDHNLQQDSDAEWEPSNDEAAAAAHDEQRESDYDSSSRRQDITSQLSHASVSGISDSASDDTQGSVIVPLDYQIPAEVLASALAADPTSSAGAWSFNLYRNSNNDPVRTPYHDSFEKAEAAAATLLNEPVLGFDLEWEEYSKPGTHSIQRCVSLLQLASESACHLFHIALFKGSTAEDLMPPSLRQLLTSAECTKAGVNVAGDAGRISRCFGFDMQGVFELSHMYKLVTFGETEPAKVNKSLIKLADQVQNILQLPLPKGEVRTSRWSTKLEKTQWEYAASDAYAGFRLFHALDHLRRELKPTPPRPAFWELRLPIELADGTLSTTKRTRKGAAVEQEDSDEFFDALETQDEGDEPAAELSGEAEQVKATAGRRKTIRPAADEVKRANEWTESFLEARSTSKQATLSAAPLRAYHLWHVQQFSLEETAALLREPPLASNTVASYVMDAIARGHLTYDVARLRKVVETLPRSVQGRYRGIVAKLGL